MAGGQESLTRRLRRSLREAFAAPEVSGTTQRRLAQVATRTRLTTAGAGLVGAALFPDLSVPERTGLAAVIVALYLPYTLVAAWLTDRTVHPLTRLLGAMADLAVVFAFIGPVPATRTVVLLGYLLVVAFYTFLSGLGAGVVTSAVAIVLAVAGERIGDGGPHHSSYTLFMYSVVLVVLTFIVDAATRERREAARFLARLHEAIAAVAPVPGLDETLDSVTTAARQASGARFAGILLNEGDHLDPRTFTGDSGAAPDGTAVELTRQAMEVAETSPSANALATGTPVVVDDLETDPQFSRWAETALRHGVRSMIAVPLPSLDGHSPLGVLSAYFDTAPPSATRTADLLETFAEHASLFIQRALAYEEERTIAARLEEADAVRSELVSDVSHELRSPLMIVQGVVDTIGQRWDTIEDAERLQLLEMAMRNSAQLRRVIDQMLDDSKLEAGAVRLALEPRSLAADVERFLHDAEPLLANHRVVTALDRGLWVMADADAVDHILLNLGSNAAKYAPEGTTIRVTTSQSGDEAVLSVADEGPGIDPGECDRVFERFFRRASSSAQPGTGIGLSIVRRYAEMMGGHAWLKSQPGRGSIFFVSFALAPSPPAGG